MATEPERTGAVMGEEQYLAERLDDQIDWYDRKSQWNQRRYKILRGIEIVAASLVFLLASFARDLPGLLAIIAGLGALIVLLGSFHGLYNFEGQGLRCRTTAEALKHERYLYLTRTPPYDGPEPFPLLVERSEHLISRENSSWVEEAQRSPDRPRRPPGG